MSEIRFHRTRRPLPRVEPPAGPWAALLDLRGDELGSAVRSWLEEGGVEVPRHDPPWEVGEGVWVTVAEGGPVHGLSPALLRLAVPGSLTVVVVSPFPGADQLRLHAVRPHPDLEREARRRGVRLTRAWDLATAGPAFASRLVEPGEGGFLTASTEGSTPEERA